MEDCCLLRIVATHSSSAEHPARNINIHRYETMWEQPFLLDLHHSLLSLRSTQGAQRLSRLVTFSRGEADAAGKGVDAASGWSRGSGHRRPTLRKQLQWRCNLRPKVAEALVVTPNLFLFFDLLRVASSGLRAASCHKRLNVHTRN